MFGREKKPQAEAQAQRDPEADRRWFDETLAALEREYVAEYGPKQPEWHAIHVSEHEADCASFSWRFERFGDFLMIKIARRDSKEAESINLSRVTSIRCHAGASPHMNGKLRLRTALVRQDGPGLWRGDADGQRTIVPPQGFRYQAIGHVGPAKHSWRLSAIKQGIESHMFAANATDRADAYCYSRGEYDHPIPSDFHEMAVPARDGYVCLYGADIAIPCPAGLEQPVHDALLAAIRDGWEKKPFPFNNGEKS